MHVPFSTRPGRSRSQLGGVLVIVVMLLALIALPLTLSQGGFARTELQVAHGEQLASQALSIAEAGLNHVYAVLKADGNGFDDELNGGGNTGGTGGLLAGLGAVADVTLEDGRSYRFVAFGGAATDGYFVRVDDNFDDASAANDPAADKDGKIWVTVRGRVGGAERVVKATVSHGTPIGVYGTNSVTINGGTADSYGGGAYVAGSALHHGNARSNATVNVGGGAVVDGNLLAGTTASVAPGATVTGTTTNGAALLSYPPPAGCAPYSGGAGISGAFGYSAVTGALTVAAGGNATLAPGSYCFGSISLSGGGTLTTSGQTTITLMGASDLSGGQIVNTTSDANRLTVNLVGAGPLLLPAVGTTGYAYVYAPGANVTIAGAGAFFGAVVGASVSLSGGAAAHVDESIAEGASITAWHELRN